MSTDIVASAPIPPSVKRQPDPPTDEEEPDAKKLKQDEESKMFNFDEIPPDLLKYLPETLKDEIPDDLLDSLHLTREELKFTDDEPMDVALLCTLEAPPGEEDVRDFPEPEYGPDDPLPKGHQWASFHPFSGDKHFIVRMCCDLCGVFFDHWPADCPKNTVQGSTGK